MHNYTKSVAHPSPLGVAFIAAFECDVHRLDWAFNDCPQPSCGVRDLGLAHDWNVRLQVQPASLQFDLYVGTISSSNDVSGTGAGGEDDSSNGLRASSDATISNSSCKQFNLREPRRWYRGRGCNRRKIVNWQLVRPIRRP